jgi:peptidoglycan L-alanyl-D-glutamate endopeptidase CwlK
MARDITQLHPRLQEKIAELKELCKKENLNIGIGECFRSVAEQDKLYAQGRTTPGSIVTNAKGSTYSSQHQWGIAFDFFKNVKGHEYDDIAFFNKVGALAKSIGLAWGGDWKSPVDKPHLYLPDWGSTTTKLKNQYGTFEKFKATWKAKSEDKPKTKTKKERILEWQKSAIADGFKFPKYGADGKWGAECEAVAKKCIIKKRALYYYPNTTRIVQRAVGVSVDGKCGKDTKAGIIAYQKKHGLVADGIVGLNTWKKILGV